MKKIHAILTISLLALLVIAVVVAASLWAKNREAQRSLSIADRNIVAMNDTIRRYQVDNTNAVNLMAFQDSVNTDSLLALNGALGESLRRERQTARTLTQTRFEFTQYRAQVEALQVVTEEGDRSATFDVEGPPIDGTVAVVAPADTLRPMVMDAALSVTPFNVTYVIGCDEQRSAFVNLESPDWVSVSMQQGTVAPDVCHPYKPVGFGSFRITAGGMVVGGAIGGALGFIIGSLAGG